LGLVPAVHRGVVAAVVPAVLPLPRGAKLTPELAEAIRRPYHLYQLDLTSFPGNSGSPLFDGGNGRVLGIINKTLATRTREHLLSEPSGITYAVPAKWIQELLIQTGVSAKAIEHAGAGDARP
jgi:S1-C subfamily serine protease